MSGSVSSAKSASGGEMINFCSIRPGWVRGASFICLFVCLFHHASPSRHCYVLFNSTLSASLDSEPAVRSQWAKIGGKILTLHAITDSLVHLVCCTSGSAAAGVS